jgi:hypothetical protein
MVRARLSGVHARRMKLLKRKDLIILDDFGIKPLHPSSTSKSDFWSFLTSGPNKINHLAA